MEIAIISGKGGTGKSSISAAFATLGEQVVLADCDVDAANLYLLFHPTPEEEEVFVSGKKAVIDDDLCNSCGICVDYCRFEAITMQDNRVTISSTACDGCGLCAHVCPFEAITMEEEDKSRMYAGSFRNGKMVYGRLAPGEENSGKLVNRVRSKAKEMATGHGLETIIIDGPPGIGCAAISTITGVDQVVVVTEPSLSGLHDLKRAVEVTDHFHLNRSVIINKYDLHEGLSLEIEQYCKSRQIAVVGKVPFSRIMVDAMVGCQSVIEWAPDSVITDIIQSSYHAIKKNAVLVR